MSDLLYFTHGHAHLPQFVHAALQGIVWALPQQLLDVNKSPWGPGSCLGAIPDPVFGLMAQQRGGRVAHGEKHEWEWVRFGVGEGFDWQPAVGALGRPALRSSLPGLTDCIHIYMRKLRSRRCFRIPK